MRLFPRSSWLPESAFNDGNGELDYYAIKGAEGYIGTSDGLPIRSVPEASVTARAEYVTRWGNVSTEAGCDRVVTLPEVHVKEHKQYCDMDGDPKTFPGYHMNTVDAVLLYAKAMDKDQLYLNMPAESDKLFTSILELDSFEGLTGVRDFPMT